MTPLQWEIRNVLKANRDGARTTQYQRHAMLFRFAGDLHRLGHRGLRLGGIGNRHVHRIVASWKAQGLKDATMMNRLSAIRWLGMKIGKPNLGHDTNRAFGLQGRAHSSKSRAERLTVTVTRRVTDPYVRVSLKLQAAFGLRRSEALKLQPRWADRGDTLRLKGSWTRGGRPRVIPIRIGYQRGVLEEAKRIAGNGSLIRAHKSYREHLHTWEHATRQAGLSKTHGLRHAYAQTRYRELTGWLAPHQGGPGRNVLKGTERELDMEARLQIAEELGHSRIRVSDVYLGR